MSASAEMSSLAFLFTDDAVSAVLWKMHAGSVEVIKSSAFIVVEELNQTIVGAALDKALDELGEDGLGAASVVFVTPTSWLAPNNEMNENRERLLKSITRDYLLKALGVIIASDALVASESQRLKKPLSGFVIQNSLNHLSIAHYANGELKGWESVGKSGEMMADSEEVRARWPKNAGLVWFINSPAASDNDNEEWQNLFNELAPSQVATLQPNNAYKTALLTGVPAILKSLPESDKNSIASAPTTSEKTAPTIKKPANQEFSVPSFVSTAKETEEIENAINTASTDVSNKTKKTNKIQSYLAQTPKWVVVLLAILLVGLVASSIFAFTIMRSWQARVDLVIQGSQISSPIEFYAITSGDSQADATRSAVPATTITERLTLEKEVPATGKKLIGDAAKGKVTITNRTLQPRTFAKGTRLVATGNLTFVTDEDVSIASASASSFSTDYGRADVKVTAEKIGSESNLKKATELSLSGLSSQDFLGIVAEDFGGGNSRETLAVAQRDIDNGLAPLRDEAVNRLKEQLSAQSSPEALILADAKTSLGSLETSAKVGTEAQTVRLQATFVMNGVRIAQKDLQSLATSQLTLGENSSLQPETINIEVQSLTGSEPIWVVSGTLNATQLPMVNGEKLKQDLAGQTFTRAEEILRQSNQFSSMQFSTKPSWLRSLIDKLPADLNRIELSLRAKT